MLDHTRDKKTTTCKGNHGYTELCNVLKYMQIFPLAFFLKLANTMTRYKNTHSSLTEKKPDKDKLPEDTKCAKGTNSWTTLKQNPSVIVWLSLVPIHFSTTLQWVLRAKYKTELLNEQKNSLCYHNYHNLLCTQTPFIKHLTVTV